MAVWRNSASRDADCGAPERRALSLLLEGTAVNQVQIDVAAYRRFRSGILRSGIQLSEPKPETELLRTVAEIVREFEVYRGESESAVETCMREWRQTASMLANLLAAHEEIDLQSSLWIGITRELAHATSTEEVQSLRTKLSKLFHRSHEELEIRQSEYLEEQDRSTANDNAAGLRGGGAAMQHFQEMIAASRPGYIGMFRLSCLDVVGERFGDEGIQDCLMAVSAFLSQNMRPEDSIYHWSDSSLLAICDRKVRQDILTAELNRMLSRNRDFTIRIGDRSIMLRIPVDLQIFPVSQFDSAEELQKLAMERPQIDRALVR